MSNAHASQAFDFGFDDVEKVAATHRPLLLKVGANGFQVSGGKRVLEQLPVGFGASFRHSEERGYPAWRERMAVWQSPQWLVQLDYG